MSTGDGESDSEHDNVNFLSPPRDNKLAHKSVSEQLTANSFVKNFNGTTRVILHFPAAAAMQFT